MSVERSVTIDAPPAKVFAVLSDIGHVREWRPGVRTIDRISSGPFGVGTQWHEVRDVAGRALEATIRVTEFAPPRRFSTQVIAKGITGRIAFTLTSRGDGTDVVYEGEMTAHGIMDLFNGRLQVWLSAGAGPLVAGLKRQAERPP